MAATNSKSLTAERLRELLHYDHQTGVFTWLISIKHSNVKVSQQAGDIHEGYARIGIDRRSYLAHNLAWLYVHGAFPLSHLDHRNRIGTDNRITNLRLATLSQNRINAFSKNNATRTRGVWKNPAGNWSVRLCKEGHTIYLGRFATKELAAIAYDKAAINLHGEFAVLNYPERISAHSQPSQP